MNDVSLLPHNEKAYKSVLEHFKTNNKTCVIQPTGTGKSFISLKFIYDNIDKNILLLAPTNVILDQFNTNIVEQILNVETSRMEQRDINRLVETRFPNITFSTYASVQNQTNNYDCIIFDEFHRIGADTWGQGVSKLLDNNPNAKVLGVTATPIRYLDDKRDMSEEIFDGDIASQMTLPEAILKGILPTSTYVSTLYSFEEDIDTIQKQIDNYKDKEKAKEYQQLLDKAKKELQSSEGLDEIFGKNIENKNGRFIIFCRNMEHMREMQEKCKEWFKKVNPNIEISEIHSSQSHAINQYYIDCFQYNESDSIKLLFSIDMLNEGLHVKNIDGVVMFRPTESPIIYTQQLGRALSVGHNEHPLIFDIVNNASAIENVVQIKDELDELIKRIREERTVGKKYDDYPTDDILLKIKNGFKIIEEQKRIIDLLSFLKVETNISFNAWLGLAKNYYEEHGDLEVPYNYNTPEGYRLGNWINRIRQAAKGHGKTKITPEQKEELTKLGMRWTKQLEFKDWLELAKQYKEEHENLDIPYSYETKEGLKLGVWITQVRQAAQGKGKYKITPEQKEELTKLGMRWDNLEKMSFEDWLELAKKYYVENGDIEVPHKYKTEEGHALGRWLATIRKAAKGQGDYEITPEQKEELTKLGMRWYNKRMEFEDWLELAKQYYKKHGDLEVPLRYKTEEGHALGQWLKHIRQAAKGQGDYKITPEQKEELTKLGMRWDDLEKDNFDYWLELAKQYKKEHGDLDVPSNYKTKDGIALGQWINNKRGAVKAKNKGKITPKQIEELSRLGMRWFSDNLDDKLQQEEITDDNIERKKKELESRLYTLLSKYDKDSLPSKEEINEDFTDQLNRKRSR